MCLFTFDTSINFWSKYPKINVIDMQPKSNKKTKMKNDKDQLILASKVSYCITIIADKNKELT